MLFLGRASNYKGMDILRHTFAFGTEKNSEELRAYLAAHYGATYDHVALYHNGRSALTVALRALVPKKSEVVVTSLTCCAVVQAVRAAGATPVYADINRETLHYGRVELEEVLENHDDVSAIIIQNTLGIPVDIAELEEVCREHDIIIIEDLAHCAGVRYPDGREVGTVGRAAALSFGKGKSIDTISGGAVIFLDKDDKPVTQPKKRPYFSETLADRWYPFHGRMIRTFYYLGLGKILTAALLKLGCIERSADSRLSTKTRLTHWQAKLALRQIKKLPKKGRPPLRDHYFVEDRDELLKRLRKLGYVFDEIWYDVPVSPSRYYKKMNFDEEACPVATEVADEIINLPTGVKKSDLTTAYKIIKEYKIDE
ncbi:aminotransferase class I/II-fold pyridoxal phosphate-dependent enzyme [Candidatus Saccharibacteria bacterium]|nr:aminotransferase class I/II-fold pyridoxal phosphate-dependent enzyme [Candidatus Saccharibacteria bacterium]